MAGLIQAGQSSCFQHNFKTHKTTHELNLFILFIIEITSISNLQVQFIEQAQPNQSQFSPVLRLENRQFCYSISLVASKQMQYLLITNIHGNNTGVKYTSSVGMAAIPVYVHIGPAIFRHHLTIIFRHHLLTCCLKTANQNRCMPMFVSCQFYANEPQLQKVMSVGCDWWILIGIGYLPSQGLS